MNLLMDALGIENYVPKPIISPLMVVLFDVIVYELIINKIFIY